MKNMESARPATLAPRADAQQKVQLRERAERRTRQIAANVEVRQRWIDADFILDEITSAGRTGALNGQAGRDVIAAGFEKEYDYDSRDSSG